MKLNLPNYGCIRFQIRADLAVSADRYPAVRAVMEQTENHTHDSRLPGGGDTSVAIFGSKFVIGGVNHRAVGNLSATQRNDDWSVGIWILLNKAGNDLPRPPRGLKPISVLTAAAANTLDPASVACSATFEYDPAQGHRSRIALPIPLIAPGEHEGITHIESAEFSSRDADAVRYRISLRQSANSDTIVHTVDFESTIDWSRSSIRGLLDRARIISTRLIDPTRR